MQGLLSFSFCKFYGISNVKLMFGLGDLKILIPEIAKFPFPVIANAPSSVFFCHVHNSEVQLSIALICKFIRVELITFISEE
jgi:hypothetical protein